MQGHTVHKNVVQNVCIVKVEYGFVYSFVHDFVRVLWQIILYFLVCMNLFFLSVALGVLAALL